MKCHWIFLTGTRINAHNKQTAQRGTSTVQTADNWKARSQL